MSLSRPCAVSPALLASRITAGRFSGQSIITLAKPRVPPE
jgi:hypothetical protein